METEKIKKLIRTKESYACENIKLPQELKENAKKLCFEYNSKWNTDEQSKKILDELFGTTSEFMVVAAPFHCDYGFNIHVKGLAVINYNCTIVDTSPVYLGKNIFVGPNVCISCVGHAIDPVQRAQSVTISKSIHIEDDVWIGANSVICGGVHIGAGSVVTKDIPAGVVAVGNPCRVIRQINEQDKISKDMMLPL